MARMLRTLAFAAVLLVLFLAAFAAAQGEIPDAVPSDGEVAHGDHAEEAESIPIDQIDTEKIENPNWQEELKRLVKLCKTIGKDMHDVFVAKKTYSQEARIMANAANLGEHLDAKHGEFRTTHHKDWTCKQAREALDSEHAKTFVTHFNQWYEGKGEIQPAISHDDAVKLVTHLRDEMEALRLMNHETKDELNAVVANLNHLRAYHEKLQASWDELQKDPNDMNCEKPFMLFLDTLHEMRAEHIPEWFNLAEGITMLWEQCKEDPNIKEEL